CSAVSHDTAARPDIRFRAKGIGHQGPPSLRRPPPEAERQSQWRNVSLNQGCGKGPKLPFRLYPIELIAPAEAAHDRGQLGQDGGQLTLEREWRVDHDQAAAAERTLRGRWSHRELDTQNFADAGAPKAARQRVRLLPALDR